MSGFPEAHRPETDTAGRPLVMLHGGIVANWMWEPQVVALTDRMVFTPDLPGFGERVCGDWPGLDTVADDMVARVTDHGVDGPFDLVGLSLGAAQAAAFGLPEDSRGLYVAHGLSVRRETASAMNAEVCAGGVPAGVRDYSGPLLAIAGEKDAAAVRRSLTALPPAAPQAQLRLAPGMHHVWNVEDTSLFNEVLRSWLNGTIDPRLMPVP